MKFHLIGIGGAGMVAVAELLAARGQEVVGSDRAESDNARRLASLGIAIHVGHDAEHVDPDAAVVVSSAIKDDNPEYAVARQRGQRILHRSEALALAATGLDFVAVAGAHGKTTTSRNAGRCPAGGGFWTRPTRSGRPCPGAPTAHIWGPGKSSSRRPMSPMGPS